MRYINIMLDKRIQFRLSKVTYDELTKEAEENGIGLPDHIRSIVNKYTIERVLKRRKNEDSV